MKRLKKFEEINSQDMMSIPTSINKAEKVKKEISDQVNRFEKNKNNNTSDCTDALSEIVDSTFDSGGNGQNLEDYLSGLADFLDGNHVNAKRDHVAMEGGWYSDETVEKFKSLLKSMANDEIADNNMSQL